MTILPHEELKITHLVLKRQYCHGSVCGVTPIIIALPDSVVIYLTGLDHMPKTVKPLTPLDAHGVMLAQIPIDMVAEWLTKEEAEKHE